MCDLTLVAILYSVLKNETATEIIVWLDCVRWSPPSRYVGSGLYSIDCFWMNAALTVSALV